MTQPQRERIGYVVGGTLKGGLRVRLTVPPQQVHEGAFVITESGGYLFYGLVTDIRLGATDQRFADERLGERIPHHLANLLQGQTLYADLEVLLALMQESPPEDPAAYERWRQEIDLGLHEKPHPIPPKTVPSHQAEVHLASKGDIEEIFGKDDADHFQIGTTREQEHPVRINLKKFVQRSAGIFGATGTGKSFLTRILLAGLIKYNKASVLAFDMHSEYGFDDKDENGNPVPGLRSKFPARVRVVGLGVGTTIRGQAPDFHLEIDAHDITPADILLLTHELNLKETTPTTLDALWQSFGREWFIRFREMRVGAKEEIVDENTGKVKRVPAPDSVEAWANETGTNVMAAEGLHNKLRRVFNKPYIVDHPASDTVQQIIDALAAGQHVFLSFGDYDTDLDYLLVTNLLTRRIRQEWEKRTNAYRTKGEQEPRQLVIVVEEAHKMLNREMASQTIFSTIAREMRKYYVTLLIVDQRPSQIYDEVMSQLGTRISGWLGDDDDIRAVLSGLAGREQLRGMLSRLQPKEEVLLLGWGVPMPLPVRTVRYDEAFWRNLLGEAGQRPNATRAMRALGFDD